METGGVSYSVRSVPITKGFNMGITSTGIAKILPVFKKALQTHKPQTTNTPTYTPLYVNR